MFKVWVFKVNMKFQVVTLKIKFELFTNFIFEFLRLGFRFLRFMFFGLSFEISSFGFMFVVFKY
jgi:hypothetical protein